MVTPAVLAAAREILARVEALNATETAAGNPALGLDIALHAGEVTYGNIGTADSLDFRVIGPAVNEAARLEGLCKALGKQILISKSLAQAACKKAKLPISSARTPTTSACVSLEPTQAAETSLQYAVDLVVRRTEAFDEMVQRPLEHRGA